MTETRARSGFWRMATALALPIALQNLLISCASLVDTAMILPLGDTAVSAVGVAGRFTFLLNVMAFGFCSGSASLISQYWGVKDQGGIRRSYGIALISAMALAFLYATVLALFPSTCISIFGSEEEPAHLAAQYVRILALGVPFMMYSQVSCAALRATEKVSVPLISSAASVLTNFSLNYCLIHGNFGFPRLAVRGAAIATVCGAIVQALIVFLFLQLGKNPVRAHFREYLAFGKDFVRKYFGVATPVFLNETLWALGTNAYVMVLARQGTEVYAGYTIYETVQQLFFVFFVGICHAAAIMVGKSVGRGEETEAFLTAKRFMLMTPLAGFVLGGLLILIREPLLSLLPIDTEIAYRTASGLLLFYGFWLGIRMISYTAICGVFRAGGDTKAGCFMDMATLYVIGIPAVCLAGLVLKLPFVAIVAVMFIAEDVPKSAVCLWYFFTKRWIRRLTKDTHTP